MPVPLPVVVPVPLVPPVLPDLKAVPILVCAGRHDPIVPTENVAQLAALLLRCGAQVEESWYSGGHELAGADAQAVSRWLSELRP